jgi:hypothetical protein
LLQSVFIMQRSSRSSRLALVLALFALPTVGCVASESEDAEGSDQALSSDEVAFTVSAFASEKKETTYTTADRIIGTRRSDDRMKDEMLPRVRAAASAVLAKTCSEISGGAGRLDGRPGNETVRAERIYVVTEFIVEVRNDQKCVTPRVALERRVNTLVTGLEADQGGSTRSAILAVGEKAAPQVLASIEARIKADGKLDLREDTTHNVTNWTINHVVRLAWLVADLKTTNARALPVLARLKSAVAPSPWAEGEVQRAIDTLSRAAH